MTRGTRGILKKTSLSPNPENQGEAEVTSSFTFAGNQNSQGDQNFLEILFGEVGNFFEPMFSSERKGSDKSEVVTSFQPDKREVGSSEDSGVVTSTRPTPMRFGDSESGGVDTSFQPTSVRFGDSESGGVVTSTRPTSVRFGDSESGGVDTSFQLHRRASHGTSTPITKTKKPKTPEIEFAPDKIEEKPTQNQQHIDSYSNAYSNSNQFSASSNLDFPSRSVLEVSGMALLLKKQEVEEFAKKSEIFSKNFEELENLIAKKGDEFVKLYKDFLENYEEIKSKPFFGSYDPSSSCFGRRWYQAYYKITRCLGDNQSQINFDLIKNTLDEISALEKKLVYVRYLSFLQFIKYFEYTKLMRTNVERAKLSEDIKQKFGKYFVQACHFISNYQENFENYQIKLTPEQIIAFDYSLKNFAYDFGLTENVKYKRAVHSTDILSQSVFNVEDKDVLKKASENANLVRQGISLFTIQQQQRHALEASYLSDVRDRRQPTHYLAYDDNFNLLRKIVYKSLDSKKNFLRYEPQLKLQACKDYIALHNYYLKHNLCDEDITIERVAKYVRDNSPQKSPDQQQSKSSFGRLSTVVKCIKTCGQSLKRSDQQPDGYKEFAGEFKQDNSKKVISRWSSCFKRSEAKIIDFSPPNPENDLVEKLTKEEGKILVSYDYFKSENLLSNVNLEQNNSKFKELATTYGYQESELDPPLIFQPSNRTYIPFPAEACQEGGDNVDKYSQPFTGTLRPRYKMVQGDVVPRGSIVAA